MSSPSPLPDASLGSETSARRNAVQLWLVLFLGLLAVDQVVKAWARWAADWTEGRSIHALWPGVFELKLVYNEGIAFGMLQGHGVWLTPIAVVIALFAFAFSWKHPHENKWTHVGMAVLASGAVGNLIDRLWMQKVTDMFWIRAINFPVFNIADVCITVAAALLGVIWVRESAQAMRESRRASVEADANPSSRAPATEPDPAE
ncbi:MAG TPA: signal peptidase II [Fimbriimonadaceae bacterium]|nr:signal peptidase II [Fimbriimonadaceae bacterium]HRJ33025.1 signal peptidase II [Fimbriimonadaceae bacterium]